MTPCNFLFQAHLIFPQIYLYPIHLHRHTQTSEGDLGKSHILSVPLTTTSPVNSRIIFIHRSLISSPYLQLLHSTDDFLSIDGIPMTHLSLPFSTKLPKIPLLLLTHSYIFPLQSCLHCPSPRPTKNPPALACKIKLAHFHP